MISTINATSIVKIASFIKSITIHNNDMGSGEKAIRITLEDGSIILLDDGLINHPYASQAEQLATILEYFGIGAVESIKNKRKYIEYYAFQLRQNSFFTDENSKRITCTKSSVHFDDWRAKNLHTNAKILKPRNGGNYFMIIGALNAILQHAQMHA